jgi:streptogramin lyase
MRAVLLAVLTLALAPPAGAVTLSEFPVPGRSFSITSISDLVVAPDSNLWFTRSDPDVPSGAELQIFDPRSERLTNVATPTAASTMVAADGAIWIAAPQFGGAPEILTRIDVATHAAETVPVEGRPLAIAAAPGGPLYVALEGQDDERYRTADIAVIDKGTRTPRRVLRLTTPHPVLGQPLGVGAPLFNGLAVASDGAVWAYELAFTTPGAPQVVKLLRLDPATGAYTEYGPLEGWSVVRRIVAGKAGDAWFQLQRFSADVDGAAPKEALGHITAAGAVEIIPYQYFGYTATGLAVTGDGAVWYDSAAVDDDRPSYLVRIDPQTRAQRAFEPLGIPVRLSLGPDGNSLWYVDWTGSQAAGPRGIVRVDPDPASTGPDIVTTANAARRGFATVVICRKACKGVARVTTVAGRSVTLGAMRFTARSGPHRVRVRLTTRGKAQLRHAKRVILRVTFRDGKKARTASRTFRPWR